MQKTWISYFHKNPKIKGFWSSHGQSILRSDLERRSRRTIFFISKYWITSVLSGFWGAGRPINTSSGESNQCISIDLTFTKPSTPWFSTNVKNDQSQARVPWIQDLLLSLWMSGAPRVYIGHPMGWVIWFFFARSSMIFCKKKEAMIPRLFQNWRILMIAWLQYSWLIVLVEGCWRWLWHVKNISRYFNIWFIWEEHLTSILWCDATYYI